MTTATAKLMYTGRSHTTSGPGAATRSSDGFVDLKLSEPHPAAEQLFASAWSACYLAAIQYVAGQRKIKLPTPPSVDTVIELYQGAGGFYLRAALNVTLPGIDRATAEELTEAAHTTCPYSKAVHGNIEIVTKVV